MITPLANIFQPLIDALESVMLFFHDNIGFGWGFSIIFLTIVVRAARSSEAGASVPQRRVRARVPAGALRRQQVPGPLRVPAHG